MQIQEYGQKGKPGLLLIHGLQHSARMWEAYIRHYEAHYHIFVPVYPIEEGKTDLLTAARCAKALEDFCLARAGDVGFGVYALSVGGMAAVRLWQNRRLRLDTLILESVPLQPLGGLVSRLITREGMKLAGKVRKRDPGLIGKAEEFLPAEELEKLLGLLDRMPDETVAAYLREVVSFALPLDLSAGGKRLVYACGGGKHEGHFRKAGVYLKQHYPQAELLCFKDKGHCEDAVLRPAVRIRRLDRYLKTW